MSRGMTDEQERAYVEGKPWLWMCYGLVVLLVIGSIAVVLTALT